MTAPVDQQPTSVTDEHSVCCSFCGKDHATAGNLVQGRDLRAYICQNCAQLCLMVFDHESMGDVTQLGTSEGETIAATWQLLSKMIDQVLSGLTPLERDVIKLRYGLSKGYSSSYTDLAERFELRPERVADVERDAVEKLGLRGA